MRISVFVSVFRLIVFVAGASALLVLLRAQTAFAASYKFCGQVNAAFTDNNIGEAYWTGDLDRPLPGAYVRVRRYPDCANTGTTGSYTEYVSKQPADVYGCTPTFSTPGGTPSTCFQFQVWNSGIAPDLNGHTLDLEVRDANGNQSYSNALFSPQTTGTITVTLPASEVRVAYATLAYAYQRFNGGVTGKKLIAYTTVDEAVCGCNGTQNRTCYSAAIAGAKICMQPTYTVSKFFMAHEYGHAILYMSIGAGVSGDFGDGGWSGDSVELQSVAISEGWADFVSADIFNLNHTTGSSGGKMHTACGPGNFVVNVEDGWGTPCVTRFMESNFDESTWPGHSAPVDWLRTFWDYHMSGDSDSWVSHARLLAELGRYKAIWNNDDDQAYDDLRKAVAQETACSAYYRLASAAIVNGADHCEHDLDDGTRVCDAVPNCLDFD